MKEKYKASFYSIIGILSIVIIMVSLSCKDKVIVSDFQKLQSDNKGYNFSKINVTKLIDSKRKEKGLSFGNGCINGDRNIAYFVYLGDLSLDETIEVNNAIFHVTGDVKMSKQAEFIKTDCEFSEIRIKGKIYK